jgi:DNA-binding CsgD family transcriptional regulator
MVHLKRGESEQAVPYLEEGRTISGEIHNRIAGHMATYNLALLAEAEGDHGRAVELHAKGLRFATEVGDVANAAYSLEGLAGVAAARGEPERAARLFGASEALLETVGAPRYVHAQDLSSYERAVEELRSPLGEKALAVAWAEGREMDLERAIEYGLQEPGTPEGAEESEEAPRVFPAGMSACEAEVLGLIAQGKTNAQIARELFISPRTVNGHLTSAYHKIGTSTHVEAARFATEHGLL